MSSRLHGRNAAPGVAVGPAFRVVTPEALPIGDDREGSASDEVTRLEGALARTVAQLNELAARISTEVGAVRRIRW